MQSKGAWVGAAPSQTVPDRKLVRARPHPAWSQGQASQVGEPSKPAERQMV